MKNSYFGHTKLKVDSPENAEIMPAAIITAIVSSILLVGMAIVISLVLTNKSEQTSEAELSTTISNVDTSLRADITQARHIEPFAKLTQPSERLLTSSDIHLNGVTLHIPSNSGECKLVTWAANGTTVTRGLTVYKETLNADRQAECDIASEVVADRDKEFEGKFLLQTPFTFDNNVGREFAYTLNGETLDEVNTELDRQLTANGEEKLSETEFNKLNKLLKPNSLVTGFADPLACAMNAARITMTNSSGEPVMDANGNSVTTCPPAETASVEDAWKATSISSVSVKFDMMSGSGETIHRDIKQPSSTPPL